MTVKLNNMRRRGAVVVTVVILVAMVNLLLIVAVRGGTGDSAAATGRVETLRALYAAESAALASIVAFESGTAPVEGGRVTIGEIELTFLTVPDLSSGEGILAVEGRSGSAVRRFEISLD